MKHNARRRRPRKGGGSRDFQPTRAKRAGQVWGVESLSDRTLDGAPITILLVVDEFTHECLWLSAEPRTTAARVAVLLDHLFHDRAVPTCVRSETLPTALLDSLQAWPETIHCPTRCLGSTDPWSPTDTAWREALLDELGDLELLRNRKHASRVVRYFRSQYNLQRPQRELGYVSPARFAARLGVARASPEPFEPPYAAAGRPALTSHHDGSTTDTPP